MVKGSTIFKHGLGDIGRRDWANGRPVPSPQVQSFQFYIGVVMDDHDEQRMGRLWVFIPQFSPNRTDNQFPYHLKSGTAPDRESGRLDYDERFRNGLILAFPMMPYFGSDESRVGNDIYNRSSYSGEVNSYGMWFQPRIGDLVGILLSSGDPSKSFWISCVPKQYRNFMVPGNSGHPVDNVFTNDLNTSDDAVMPAMDKARGSDVPNPGEFFINTPFARNLIASGLGCDLQRGAGTSSSRRESPSYVSGIKTPGWTFEGERYNKDVDGEQFDNKSDKFSTKDHYGHSLTFDDHPDYQSIRLRTALGSQILLDESCDQPYIYISTAKGNVWIELSDSGEISVYGKGSFNLHAEQDINLTANGDINIEAQNNLNILARKNMVMNAEGETNWGFGRNGGNTPSPLKIHSYGNVDWTIRENFSCNVKKDFSCNVEGNFNWLIGMDIFVESTGNMNMKSQGEINQESTGNMNMKSQGEINQESTGNINIKSEGEINQESTGNINIKSEGDFLQQSMRNMNMKSEGEFRQQSTGDFSVFTDGIYREDASAIFMGTPGSFADTPPPLVFSIDSIEPIGAIMTELPSFPLLNEIPGEPTTEQISMCLFGNIMQYLAPIVPQHQPWPFRCDRNRGFNGYISYNNDYAASVRRGSSSPDAEKPLPKVNSSGYCVGKLYKTSAKEEPPEYENPSRTPNPGELKPSKDYTASNRVINFIKQKESFSSTPYRDAGRRWAIGYGHNIRIGDMIDGKIVNREFIQELNRTNGRSLTINESQAEDLLEQDIMIVEEGLASTITAEISQGQYDALVSLAYNVGLGALSRSRTLSAINDGRIEDATREFMGFNIVNGRMNEGLTRRRREELEQFFSYAENPDNSLDLSSI